MLLFLPFGGDETEFRLFFVLSSELYFSNTKTVAVDSSSSFLQKFKMFETQRLLEERCGERRLGVDARHPGRVVGRVVVVVGRGSEYRGVGAGQGRGGQGRGLLHRAGNRAGPSPRAHHAPGYWTLRHGGAVAGRGPASAVAASTAGFVGIVVVNFHCKETAKVCQGM